MPLPGIASPITSLISPWGEPDAVEEIKLWLNCKGFPSSVRASALTDATTPTLAEFRRFRHIATTRVPEPETVDETEVSDEELERFQEVLSTLTPSRVRFLYRLRWEICRLNPGGIPRLADVQFLLTAQAPSTLQREIEHPTAQARSTLHVRSEHPTA